MTNEDAPADALPDKQPQHNRKRPNTTRTGELAEAAFLLKAERHGLRVSKPWGDSERYDFLLDSSGRLCRVQVKCTQSASAGGFQVQSTYCDKHKKGKYTPQDIDFLVAYIIPLDLWYIVPARAFPASASIRLYPNGGCQRPRFEIYREAWHLFQSHPQQTHPAPPILDAIPSPERTLNPVPTAPNPPIAAPPQPTSSPLHFNSPAIRRIEETRKRLEKWFGVVPAAPKSQDENEDEGSR